MVNIRQSWLIFLGRDDAPTRFLFRRIKATCGGGDAAKSQTPKRISGMDAPEVSTKKKGLDSRNSEWNPAVKFMHPEMRCEKHGMFSNHYDF